MKKRTKKSCPACAVFAVCLSLSTVLWAKEEFQARLLTFAGEQAGIAEKLIISIESYTTLEEVSQLRGILEKNGFDPFMTAFIGINKGIVRPVGGRGLKVTIHAAHIVQKDSRRQIFLFTQRQSWDVGVQQRIDRRFAFMVIELNVNEKGKGDGKIYDQASIRFTPYGTLEMESFNSPPRQLFGVSLLK